MQWKDDVYLVVLAGGSGTRFWPKSRQKRPKQLCAIGDSDLTMIEQTLARFDQCVSPERRIIVTHCDQLEATQNIVGDRCQHYIAEPEARNTANALCLAALEIEALYQGKATMVSVHADHLIANPDQFIKDIETAIEEAQNDRLMLLGIKPTGPETGFGYIQMGAKLNQAYRVDAFKEKPDLETAKTYLESGKYLWNSGIFIWKTETILSELKEFLPHAVNKLSECLSGETSFSKIPFESLKSVYAQLPKIAIDNAVLEVSQKVSVLPTDFGWRDVGSWDALHESFPCDENGNYVSGDVLFIDSKNNTVTGDDNFVALIGVEDLVVVCEKDAVLVCPRSRAQDVKKVVEHLKSKEKSSLL